MATADEQVAEESTRDLDRRIGVLTAERLELTRAADRILEIDAKLAILNAEKARLVPRLPPQRTARV